MVQSPYLEATNLKKSYAGRTVVKGVSLKLKQGEVVGLLGPNGAGKTTSFYMIVGLVRSEEGAITLKGEDITSLPLHSRALLGVGYLPQEASVFRDLSVEANIYSVLENRKLPTSKKKGLLGTLIDDFGLGHIRKSLGGALSGGERRRVEIARALALEPKFILLDEPFAGVDPLAVSDIQNIIKKLKQRNIGVLITDHNVRETLDICSRAFIVNDGIIIAEGTSQEVLENNLVKSVYLGENFKL